MVLSFCVLPTGWSAIKTPVRIAAEQCTAQVLFVKTLFIHAIPKKIPPVFYGFRMTDLNKYALFMTRSSDHSYLFNEVFDVVGCCPVAGFVFV